MAGRKKEERFELTAANLEKIKSLAGYGLTRPQIAAALGISERGLCRHKNDHEVVRQALEAGKAIAQAQVGEALFKKAKSGDVQAIRWWEMTRAGRSERSATEHTGPNGGPIQNEVLISDAHARLADIVGRHARGRAPGGAQPADDGGGGSDRLRLEGDVGPT